MTHPASRWTRPLLALATAAVLAACGGGSGGGEDTAAVADSRAPEAIANDAVDASPADPAPGASDMVMIDGRQFLASPCASDGGLCQFSGARLVAYGSGSSFVMQELSGPVRCDAATFGLAVPQAQCHLDASTPASTGSGVAADDNAAERSLALSWAVPQTNDDGTPLTDLAGYRIYYGSSPGHYGASVALDNPSATSYELQALPAGTWYVVVRAVNRAGAQSIASPEVSKTIQ